MKKLILSFGLVVAASFALIAQEKTEGPVDGPEITFEKEVHDFGTVKQYGNTTTEFVFKNSGTKPLVISHAKGSCGCTVPSWPKEPIKPGETAAIKVKYDNKRVGPINKSVTIRSNATNEPTKIIRIKGKIEPAPKESNDQTPEKRPAQGAPVNN